MVEQVSLSVLNNIVFATSSADKAAPFDRSVLRTQLPHYSTVVLHLWNTKI